MHKYQQKSIIFLVINIFIYCIYQNNYNKFSINIMPSMINTRSNSFHKLNPHLTNPKGRNNIITVVDTLTCHTDSPFIYMLNYILLLLIY